MRTETESVERRDTPGAGREASGDGREPVRHRRRGGSWILAALALAVLAAAAAWAYLANARAERAAMDMTVRAPAGDAAFPVTVAPAGRGPIAGMVTYTGTVAAFNEEEIYPRVTGRIVEMLVYPGDVVHAGQLVARLDDVELSSKVREAEAMAATAEANRAQMDADLTAARHGVAQMERELAMVEAELVYARGVAARSARLVGVGAISQQEYENDRSMAASLEAKGEAARARLEQARAMEASAARKLEAAGAMLAQGRAALQTAGVVRDYVNIHARVSGHVVKRLVAPGVLVQPGTAILKIAQIDRVRLQANVGENDVAAIRVGSAVRVTSTATREAAVDARVSAVFPFVDPGGRTAVVEAVVDNAGRRFLPGQYVTMRFVTGERADAVTVPAGAVTRMGARATVWTVEEGRAEPRAVTTGLETSDRIEIVQGLTGAERVVTRGHEGLYAGARVKDVTARGDSPPGAPAEGAAPAPPATRPSPAKERPHAAH